MKSLAFILFLPLYCFPTYEQPVFNARLKHQLDSIMSLDQKYRGILSNGIANSVQQDSIAKVLNLETKDLVGTLWKLQNSIDSMNLLFVEEVISKYGYPGRTLVGEETCVVVWHVIQHSSKIDKYLGLIKKAAAEKELPFKLYAMMYDRWLVNNKKEQIYGTQIKMLHLKNGERDWFVYPIRNPKKVNRLRKKAGLELSVEENAKRLDVNYRVIKISEIM